MAEDKKTGGLTDANGEVKIKVTSFRDFISSKPGSKFTPEANRYHLYVSYGCPWATRTLIMRRLKGLASIIGLSVVHWHRDEDGWKFPSKDDPCEGATEEPLYHFQRIKELYFKANPQYEGRFTVPVLWDKKLETIVNNESSEIIRMFNSEFDSLLGAKFQQLDFYPTDLRIKVDGMNKLILENISSGAYKAGFATKQEVYEKEVKNLFEHLDKVEKILEENASRGEKYITGSRLTEADMLLFVTIIRFDPVYVQHFKCNLGMIRYDYPAIHAWLKHLYWEIPGFKEETNFDHIKLGHISSQRQVNPHGIVPLGPLPNILPL